MSGNLINLPVVEASNPNWVDIATFVVLTVTLLVLCWYTSETYLLRRATYRQIEVGYMPILALDVRTRGIDKGGFLEVCNKGYGPAFNVGISDLVNRGCRITADEIPLLAKGACQVATVEIVLDSEAEPLSDLSFEYFLSQDPESQEVPLSNSVRATYTDAAGVRQSTEYEVIFHRPPVPKATVIYRGAG